MLHELKKNYSKLDNIFNAYNLHVTYIRGYTVCLHLIHWGRDKMAAIFRTTFTNVFSWMKMYKFRLKFHCSLFQRVQLRISQHWFRKWLGASQATSHFLNQCWLVYWRIYASPCLNELSECSGLESLFRTPKLGHHTNCSLGPLLLT